MNSQFLHIKLSQWKKQHLLSVMLFLCCSFASFLLIRHWALGNGYTYTILIAITAFFIYRFYQYRPLLGKLVNDLNQENPELEFSTSVLIKDPKNLKPLEKLQAEKIEQRLSNLQWAPSWNKMLFLNSIACLVLFTFFGFITDYSYMNYDEEKSEANPEFIDGFSSENELLLEELVVTVKPPSYTMAPTKRQEPEALKLPEGSQVSWKFQFNQSPDSLSLSISGKELNLNGLNQYEEVFYESSFYQITYGNSPPFEVSEYYPLTVTKDKKPDIVIAGIQEYTLMQYDSSHVIDFSVEIEDDYQLEDAFVLATVAKGSGESVKFREKRIEIPGFKKGSSLKTDCKLNVADLNMEPGSELYFYISAKDNCPFRTNVSKSLTYIFVFEDTASYDAWDDGGMQVDLMPDFFRSQRQIIIDSEQLLKDQFKISPLEFNQRSNELGFDQKQLRLKYGQFLGEESESGIAIEPEIDELVYHDHDHDIPLPGENRILDWGREVLEQFGHDHDHENEAGQRFEEAGTMAQEDPARPSWVEELSHNHDNAEINTYFEMPVKSKLKAALSQMWDSELHLRLYDPASSLPFQYQALKLLQEIKNHARIYVHRLGFDPPPIKEEKRLSGELEEIVSSTLQVEEKENPLLNHLSELNLVLSSLNAHRGQPIPFDVKSDLKQLGDQISAFASTSLDLLPLLTSLQDIIQSEAAFSPVDLVDIQQEILKNIPDDGPTNIRSNQLDLSELKSNLIELYKTANQ